MALLLTRLGKVELARTYFRDIKNNHDLYYFTFGKTDEWADESNPDTPVDSTKDITAFRKNMMFIQRITGTNVCHLVRRINWTSGTTYDRYDDVYYSSQAATEKSWQTATHLGDANFYVMTVDYNIYKCLDNRNESGIVVPSTDPPTTTGLEIEITGDNYKWKYMGTVSEGDRTRFLDDNWIPVRKVAGSADDTFDITGEIDDVTVVDGGTGYSSGLVIVVQGDGSGVAAASASLNSSTGAIETVTLTSSQTTEAGSGQGYSFAILTLLDNISLAGTWSYDTSSNILTGVNGDATTATSPSTVGRIIKDENRQVVGVVANVVDDNTIQLAANAVVSYRDPNTNALLTSVTGKTLSSDHGGNDAELKVNLADPDSVLTLAQKAVEDESSNIAGQIDRIEVIDAGSGFAQGDTLVSISGDGQDATAVAVIDANGGVSKIIVNTQGTGYTYADVTVYSSSDPTNFVYGRAVIGPILGHGNNMVRELFSTSLALSISLSDPTNDDLILNNDFRQIGLGKNFLDLSGNVFTSTTGRTTYKVELANATEYAKWSSLDLTTDDTLTGTNNIVTMGSGGTARVVQVLEDGNGYYLYLQAITATDIATTAPFDDIIGSADTTTGSGINSVTAPEFSYKTGEIVYMENRGGISRQADQAEVIKTFITF